MARCVGVVFSPGGKVQRYAAGELELRWNDHVVCETPRGEELGRVVLAPHDWAPEGGVPPRPVLRAATADGRARGSRARRGGRGELLKHLRELLRRDCLAGERGALRHLARRHARRRSGTAPRSASSCAASPASSAGARAAASSCARRRRARRRACARAAACAARSSAATATRRTSSRSRCAWRRTRSSR